MRWQDEVSDEQWRNWMHLAEGYSRRKLIATSLGPEDFAARAMEKLLKQENRPVNVEAWLRMVISNQYIDWLRRDDVRDGGAIHPETEAHWEREMLTQAVGSPSVLVYLRESAAEVLEVLTADEQEILLLETRGFDNHQIARQMGLKSNKIAATRLGQIKKKIRERVDLSGTSQN